MNKLKIFVPIHPEWCEKIFNWEKRIEVRKFRPKIDTPFEVLVYCTKAKNIREDGLYLLPNDSQLHLGCEEKDLSFVREEGDFRNGKVIGSFVCDGVDHIHTLGFDDKMSKQTCLTFGELSRYLGGVNGMFYGWHITEPKLFDKPKMVTEFAVYGRCAQECSEYDICMKYDSKETRVECPDFAKAPLKRAPQSWCYVEEI